MCVVFMKNMIANDILDMHKKSESPGIEVGSDFDSR